MPVVRMPVKPAATSTPPEVSASGTAVQGGGALPVLVTGIRPTGRLHVGNLVGAIRGLREYQRRYRCYYFVADVHALTTPDLSAAPLAVRALHVARAYLAAGLDPRRSTLYRQSALAGQVCELATYLAMVTPLGELLRCPTFKEKARRHPDHVSYGLAGYPVLMAADILLLKAERVPVGKDQLPHLELARSIARRFNRRFGPLFVEPHPVPDNAVLVPSLSGRHKMSKSDDPESAVFIDEPPDEIARKVGLAVSDPQRLYRHQPGHPTEEACNVFHLHTFFTSPAERDTIVRECLSAAIGCVECKKRLARSIEAFVAPLQQALDRLSDDEVTAILRAGEARARREAEQTLSAVREALGLRQV